MSTRNQMTGRWCRPFRNDGVGNAVNELYWRPEMSGVKTGDLSGTGKIPSPFRCANR